MDKSCVCVKNEKITIKQLMTYVQLKWYFFVL